VNIILLETAQRRFDACGGRTATLAFPASGALRLDEHNLAVDHLDQRRIGR
jgi:hypothetical protein